MNVQLRCVLARTGGAKLRGIATLSQDLEL
jgi:hypothetical protein